MLLPVLRKRLAERNSDQGAGEPRLDAIEWSLGLESSNEVDEERLAAELMHGLWAGTSAPGGLVTEIMFQLLLESHYKEHLINEGIEALGDDNKWTERALSKLPLLDSFIRETNRLNPTGSSKVST